MTHIEGDFSKNSTVNPKVKHVGKTMDSQFLKTMKISTNLLFPVGNFCVYKMNIL